MIEQIVQDGVRLAMEMGATAVECSASEGDEFTATVRMGEVETVKESGSRSAGIRVMIGRRAGSSYTSDLTNDGIRSMVRQAVDLAALTGEDPNSGLPDPGELGKFEGDLALYNDDVGQLDAATKIEMARKAERSALDVDARINNSEGGSFGSGVSTHAFANSLGFHGAYKGSSCWLSVTPVARDGDSMEQDHYYTANRSAALLEPPEQVGQLAAKRVLRRLNARKVPTQKAAVIFEPRVASSLVGHVFEAINGDAIYRKASFLADKLGQRIASEHVTIIDDPTIPGLFGSSPFDDEGVPSRRTVIVENGILRNFLNNTYTARTLGMRTTGSASRGGSGNLSVGHGNFYLEPGSRTAEELIRSLGTGLYVTGLMGQGTNTVTGDYSRGASGLWIENGELAFAVSEVTIASNLMEMLNGMQMANDLEFRTSTAAPTILIREMTISGS